MAIKTKYFSQSGLIVSVLTAVVIILVNTAFIKSSASGKEKEKAERVSAAQRELDSKNAFLKAYKVFMHPRCMNCHPAGDEPLQGDDSHIHLQNVTRGRDGKGLYAMKCKSCHQDANLAALNSPPGSPNWSMPPAKRKMIFQGKSPRQLAEQFKNNSFTGFKTMQDMIKHVEEEKLVIAAFNPPRGVTKIPLSQKEFADAVKEWINKGAALPDK